MKDNMTMAQMENRIESLIELVKCDLKRVAAMDRKLKLIRKELESR